jgi:hypothetical protein
MTSEELQNVLGMLPHGKPPEVLIKTPYGTYKVEGVETDFNTRTVRLITEPNPVEKAK